MKNAMRDENAMRASAVNPMYYNPRIYQSAGECGWQRVGFSCQQCNGWFRLRQPHLCKLQQQMHRQNPLGG